MTRNEIIAKTLKEIGPPLEEHEAPYSEEHDWEESIAAELDRRLPDGVDIKTCEDFNHLGVECCESCHGIYAHYEMNLVDLPNGGKAWVCDHVRRAIYPE